MRTIQEIKDSITTAVLTDSTLRSVFDLDVAVRWESQVSQASVLNMMIYIFACAQYTLECLFDSFKVDIENFVSSTRPGTIAWYWNKAIAFQYGDDITASGTYDTIDETKQIIAHCAIREAGYGLMIKVNKADYATLEEAEMAAFKAYMNRIKFAGTQIEVFSYESDKMNISISLWRNAMLLNADGTPIGGSDNVIEAAVTQYLDTVTYGGEINRTKIIQAILSVTGVEDVKIDNCLIAAFDDDQTTATLDQNYVSVCGHVVVDTLTINDIRYYE